MSYDDFRAYLHRLKSSNDEEVKIHWPVVDIDGVDAKDHKGHASLQLADVVASSFAAGFEPDRYGNCELRYAELLRRVTYCRKRNYLSYGVKVVPKVDTMVLNDQQQRMVSLWK
jgi:hypothetical protein